MNKKKEIWQESYGVDTKYNKSHRILEKQTIKTTVQDIKFMSGTVFFGNRLLTLRGK
ncbi:MAG: hypothetical protein U0L59_03165 [Faecalimonas sp.]|nr:hypothetical protein [Faecalimonas sp.]